MQTQYQTSPARAQNGQPFGSPRMSVPRSLPLLAQIQTVTTAAGTATDDWVITVVDDETSQQYVLTVPGDADEAVLATNAAAAFAESGLRNLFTASFDGSSDAVGTFTAKHGGRSYSFSSTGGTGANSTAQTQAPGGSSLAFGLMVANSSTEGEMRPLESGDTVDNMAGILFRTDGNHYQDFDEDGTAVAVARRGGRSHEVMEEGRVWVEAETALALASSVYVRISGAGTIGALGGTADGGNTVEVTDFVRVEKAAGAGGLAMVRIHKHR